MNRFVDLAIAGDGLDWPAAPCRPWLSRQATGDLRRVDLQLPKFRNNLSVRSYGTDRFPEKSVTIYLRNFLEAQRSAF